MPELITRSGDEYVEKIVALATDLDSLAAMRALLRDQMKNSIICDATKFARSMENAWRQMWHSWCEGSPA
jgi:predicted O-linked N-acetylglucosamine transferase (SPINDLY family)